MRQTTEEHRERVFEGVAEYLIKNADLLPESIRNSQSSKNHIVSIGTSIMMCKWDLEDKGRHGSFVNSFINNDLMATMSSADEVNQQTIPFYCKLVYNLGYIQ